MVRQREPVGVALAVNVKNELTTAVGLTCTYDGHGDLAYRVYDSSGPKSYTYVYDRNLSECSRVRKAYYWSGAWTRNGETRYIYDGMRVIQERNLSNTPTVAYTRGRDLSGSFEGASGIGGLFGRSHGYSAGTWSTHNHYHADGNGNVTFLVNSGQTAEAWYRFDPYGRTMAQSATALTTENLYRFSSKEIHAQSGMYYYGFRFYDPHLQRWPNRDPLGEAGGPNDYRFVNNDPIDWVDPLGERGWKDWVSILSCAFSMWFSDEHKAVRTPTSERLRQEAALAQENKVRQRPTASGRPPKLKLVAIGPILELLPGTLDEILRARDDMNGGGWSEWLDALRRAGQPTQEEWEVGPGA